MKFQSFSYLAVQRYSRINLTNYETSGTEGLEDGSLVEETTLY